MLLIWGSRWRQNKEGIVHLECVICKTQEVLNAHSTRRWFTFFFIPIFPTSAKKYYLECPYCENSYTLKEGINIEKLLENN